MPSEAALHTEEAEMSEEEIAAAMGELLAGEACRVARELIESGVCPWCRSSTLRIVSCAGAYALTCRCTFKTLPD